MVESSNRDGKKKGVAASEVSKKARSLYKDSVVACLTHPVFGGQTDSHLSFPPTGRAVG